MSKDLIVLGFFLVFTMLVVIDGRLKQQHAMIVGIKQQTDKTADPKLWTMEIIEKGCKNEN